MKHQHDVVEYFGGLYADEPQGPRTFHEIWWECAGCGKVWDEAAKVRAIRRDETERAIGVV